MFPSIPKRIPEGQYGEAKVIHFEVDRDAAMLSCFRREPLSPGRYARLTVGGRLVMSDTDMERNTNRNVVRHAHGRVLIGGLGVGMILDPILAKPDVVAVTVLEKSADVIRLIAPNYIHPKLQVVHADVFDRPVAGGSLFNCIYFDIWPDICLDNLSEINRLHRRYRKHLDRSDPEAWIGSWQHDHLKRLQRQESRRGAYC